MLNLRGAIAGVGLLAAATLAGGAAAAAPIDGYVTTPLNLRAGPGTDYPVVATMGTGGAVTIFGCLSGWSWCDISWNGYRGWAAGRYLEVFYHRERRPIFDYGQYAAVPFLSFSIGSYWGDHYRHRRFYGDMRRFEGRRQPMGPPPGFGQPPYGPAQQLPHHYQGPRHFNQPHGPMLNQPPKGPMPFNKRHPHGPPMPNIHGPQNQNGQPVNHCPPGKEFINGRCH